MTVYFRNVLISIEADDPKAAYDRLCDVLGSAAAEGDLEWATDTYTVHEYRRKETEPRKTSRLWP